jgi:hypothetical protein
MIYGDDPRRLKSLDGSRPSTSPSSSRTARSSRAGTARTSRDPRRYPDAARAEGRAKPERRQVILSVAPGWEFADLAGRHHAGGGSHDHSSRDSEVPMLTVGIGPPPGSITGIKGLVLEHFGVAVAEAA